MKNMSKALITGGISTLYIVTHRDSGKPYIGWTSQAFKARRWRHEYDAEHGSSYYFHRALMKHGFEAFNWEVIQCFDTPEEAKQAEIFWIAELNTNVKRGGFGYNETDGGDGACGYQHDESALRRIAEASRLSSTRESKRLKMLSKGVDHASKQPEARLASSRRLRDPNHPIRTLKAISKMKNTLATPENRRKRSLQTRGENNNSAKLTWENVELIRSSPLSHNELALILALGQEL